MHDRIVRSLGRITGAVLALAIAAPVVFCEPTISEIDARVTEIWAEIDSYTADISVTRTDSFLTQAPLTGLLAGKRGEEGSESFQTYIHLESDASLSDSQDIQSTVIFDGEWVYGLLRVDDEHMPDPLVIATKAKRGSLPRLSGRDVFEQFMDDYSLASRPSKEVRGEQAWVVEASAKPDAPVVARSIEIAIGQQSGMIIEAVYFVEDGREILRLDVSNLEKNAHVDDTLFEFTPPEGVEVKVEERTSLP